MYSISLARILFQTYYLLHYAAYQYIKAVAINEKKIALDIYFTTTRTCEYSG